MFGEINPQTLAEVNTRFYESYNTDDSIEKLFTRIEECMDMADAGKTPFTPVQVIRNTYNLIYQTRLYDDTCKVWDKMMTRSKLGKS